MANWVLLDLGRHDACHRVRVSLLHYHLVMLEVLLLWVMTVSILFLLMVLSHVSPGISNIRSLHMGNSLSSRLILGLVLRGIDGIGATLHRLVVLRGPLLLHDWVVLWVGSPASKRVKLLRLWLWSISIEVAVCWIEAR